MAGSELDPLTYKGSGVNYDLMDPFKIECQQAALTTASNIERFSEFGLDVHEVTDSRGESSYGVAMGIAKPTNLVLRHVIEGIGSKNVISDHASNMGEKLRIADEARRVLGKSFYRGVSRCNGATVLNDLASSAATPVSFLLFMATGSSDWFNDQERRTDLIEGNVDLCNLARCSWGGGETQTLVDMLYPNQAVLAGSATGLQFPDHVRYPSEQNLKPGLAITFVECDGPQTNGYTLLRRGMLDQVAKAAGLPADKRLDAYGYDIGNGQTYAEAILAPSVILTPLVDKLTLDKNPTPIEYITHISGHGWSKLMRGRQELSYVIDKIPEPPPIFKFIQEMTGMSLAEIYRTFNMGTVAALFTEERYVPKVVEAGRELGLRMLPGGATEAGPKRVVIRPINVTYEEDALQIR